MTDEQLTILAKRFCATVLPATVCADQCATDPNYAYPRTGTNLLTVAEAKEVLSAVLATPSGEVERLRAALKQCHDAIKEFERYQYGGETRGSYDGKPERAGLWRSMHKARAALSEAEGE